MKRKIFYLAIVSLFLLSSFVAQAQSGKPKMVLVKDTFDAGEVYRNDQKIEHTFIIKNEGTANLKILNVSPG